MQLKTVSSISCIIYFFLSLLHSSNSTYSIGISLISLYLLSRFISNDVDDLCPERELFLILKKELCIADDYRFTDKQKNEIYNLLNCTDTMRQKRQLPYKRLLQILSKTCVEEFH